MHWLLHHRTAPNPRRPQAVILNQGQSASADGRSEESRGTPRTHARCLGAPCLAPETWDEKPLSSRISPVIPTEGPLPLAELPNLPAGCHSEPRPIRAADSRREESRENPRTHAARQPSATAPGCPMSRESPGRRGDLLHQHSALVRHRRRHPHRAHPQQVLSRRRPRCRPRRLPRQCRRRHPLPQIFRDETHRPTRHPHRPSPTPPPHLASLDKRNCQMKTS